MLDPSPFSWFMSGQSKCKLFEWINACSNNYICSLTCNHNNNKKRLLKPSHLSFEEPWFQVTRTVTQLTVVSFLSSVFMGNCIFRQTICCKSDLLIFGGKMRGAGRGINTPKCNKGQCRSDANPACAMFFACLLVVLYLFPEDCLRPSHLDRDSHMPCNPQTLWSRRMALV